MDDMVRAALAKWPNVPDCYGWLALDLRGQWRLGEERQAVTNATMNAFISRNYQHDDEGRWLFQNGPQRVFVQLDYTPWVYRLVPDGDALALLNHLGERFTSPDAAWLDENGRFLIEARGAIGVLHDHDAAALLELLVDEQQQPLDGDQLADALERLMTGDAKKLYLGWPVGLPVLLESIDSQTVASRFAFNPAPKAGVQPAVQPDLQPMPTGS